ncbi:MAG: hypothetical protein Q9170_006242 [Blastenia crenularia]
MSSFSEEGSKRPKIDTKPSSNGTGTSLPAAASDRLSDRRRSGQLEERKRGQRLFGALLGTLSQSSSSTAQKRRTDIERKQQAKLRVQAEEFDEQKKQRLESLMAVRRKEQKKYDKQSMHIRHSNMLSQAHFLETKAEPKLYYMPWELLPSEETRIKSQVEAAEAIVQEETAKFESEAAENNAESQPDSKAPDVEETSNDEQEAKVTKETVGPENDNLQEANDLANNGPTNKKPEPSPTETQQVPTEPQETSKDQEDDGGEMVEADEDMVIY